MQIVTIPVMQEVIHFVVIKLREALLIHGPAGCGKTEGVDQVASSEHDCPVWLLAKYPEFADPDKWERRGLNCDVRLGQYASVDLRGIPVPDAERNQTVWYPPLTLPFKGNPMWPKNRIIFLTLDEIGHAKQDVQGPAYQLVNERRIGEHVLMDNVVIVAMTNRDMDKGVMNRMAAPLNNRFTHVGVEHDYAALCQHAQDVGQPPLAIAFWQWQKGEIFTFDPDNPNEKAYGTGRSWFKAIKYYSDQSAPLHVRKAAFAGAVGDGLMHKFYAFTEVWQKVIKTKDVIADPSGCPLPDELSMIYATAVSLSGDMDPKNVDAIHTYLERMDVEYVVLAWTLATRRDDSLMTTNAFVKRYSKKYIELFN